MKKFGYSVAIASVSALSLMAASPEAYADAASQAEIAALKAQLKEMAVQQEKAAAVIEKLAAQVDRLQKQSVAQAGEMSGIQQQQKQQQQQVSQATQAVELARVEPASGGRQDGGAYLGAFGGWGRHGDSGLHQLGTAFFTEAQGGPESVNANGRVKTSSTGFVGVQAGYELPHDDDARLLPAVEVEALYLTREKQEARLLNPTLRLSERLFNDTIPTSTAVVLANAVVGFKTPYQSITPYIGGGIGAAYIRADGASSSQLDPAEPGINHFNSKPGSSSFTAAAQLKAGARVALSDRTYLFGEYRYLYVGAHEQTFGAASYASHVPTSPWTVSYDGTSYNLLTAGIGVRF